MNQITSDLAALVGVLPPTTSQASPSSQANAGQATALQAATSGNSVPSTTSASGQIQPAALKQALVQVNDYLQSQSRTLQFSVDNTTHQTLIKVVDQSTGQVLRQIPPESMVVLAQRLQEFQHMDTTGVAVKT